MPVAFCPLSRHGCNDRNKDILYRLRQKRARQYNLIALSLARVPVTPPRQYRFQRGIAIDAFKIRHRYIYGHDVSGRSRGSAGAGYR